MLDKSGRPKPAGHHGAGVSSPISAMIRVIVLG